MTPSETSPRLAVRAVILDDQQRLLLVNAWAKGSDLMCAPGGGVHLHEALPEALIREVREETGLEITVGPVCLVNEFHAPGKDFHQVDVYFRARIESGQISAAWQDVDQVVKTRRWVDRATFKRLHVKPDSLEAVAWGSDRDGDAITYDPLEPLVK